MFIVDDIQTCEPDALKNVEGVTVIIGEDDSMGFPRAAILAPTRDELIAYVRSEWGDEDPDWFRQWVVDRIWEIDPDDVAAYRDANEMLTAYSAIVVGHLPIMRDRVLRVEDGNALRLHQRLAVAHGDNEGVSCFMLAGRREDAYSLIESVFGPAAVCDDLDESADDGAVRDYFRTAPPVEATTGQRTYLTARFDVTDLTDDERGNLAMYVSVQHEGGNDGDYPAVPVPEIEWDTV